MIRQVICFIPWLLREITVFRMNRRTLRQVLDGGIGVTALRLQRTCLEQCGILDFNNTDAKVVIRCACIR